MACPLGVYRDMAFIKPGKVNVALEGTVTIVEVIFTIKHYYLCRKTFDKVTGNKKMQARSMPMPGSISKWGTFP
jgi:hypothetical protein